MKTIVWVTPRYFVETDIYIIKQLLQDYRIYWYIIENNQCSEYAELLCEIKSHTNCTVFHEYLPAKNRSIRTLLFYRNLLNRINKIFPDIIYNPIFGMPYYMPLLFSMVNRKKTVVAVHNVTTPKGAKASAFISKLYTYFVTHAFLNYHTLSKSQCDILCNIARNKNVFYIPFLLKDYGSSDVKKSNEPTFLFFGQILEYKRLDVLINAAEEAYAKSRIKFKVKIAGSCPYWDRYSALIKTPELFDLTIRRIDNNEIPNLFASSHYFVMPYQDIAQSGAMMVAINYELPIIASDLPAFTEYITNGVNGYIIEPASVKDLRDAMLKVLNNSSDYHELKENMVVLKESKFEDSVIKQAYINMFDNIIRNNEIK